MDFPDVMAEENAAADIKGLNIDKLGGPTGAF